MNHPCAKCEHAEHFPIGKGVKHWHYCNLGGCQLLVKYEKRKHDSRKYQKGVPVKEIGELLAKEFVFMFGRPYHIEAVKSLQLRTVLDSLNNGRIFEAVKKGDK